MIQPTIQLAIRHVPSIVYTAHCLSLKALPEMTFYHWLFVSMLAMVIELGIMYQYGNGGIRDSPLDTVGRHVIKMTSPLDTVLLTPVGGYDDCRECQRIRKFAVCGLGYPDSCY
jgi:hypothetical protein